jgi:nucleoside-diphosphate-sugar epimerase
MMRALVTGATGMVGSYIVEQLRAQGWTARALVRRAEGAEWLEGLGAERAVGSLDDATSLREAARSCDVVFHAAAAIGSGGEWESYRRSNVLGTANVIAAAASAGARLVHVSSTAVFGRDRYRGEPLDENAPLSILPESDVYGRSKQEAERAVLLAHQAGKVWATVVRPPVMYGRRDRQFVPRVGPVLTRGFFPLIGGGRARLTMVHAGNVADGAVLAAISDCAGGQVYHLTNDHPVDAALLVECARRGLEREIWAPVVPLAVGASGFAALAVALRLIGRGDLARHAGGTFEMLTRDNPFTSARAVRELGWAPKVLPAVGLTDAFGWWRNSVHLHAGSGR